MKLGDSMVGVVIAATEVEVEYVDRVYLPDDTIVLSDANLVGDVLCRSEEDAMEEVALLGQLYFHNDILAFAGLGLHIHAVHLVLAGILVSLALQNLSDGHRLIEEHLNESLKHFLVRLVAKNTLDGPVETYIFTLLCHGQQIISTIWVCKDRKKKPNHQAIQGDFFIKVSFRQEIYIDRHKTERTRTSHTQY